MDMRHCQQTLNTILQSLLFLPGFHVIEYVLIFLSFFTLYIIYLILILQAKNTENVIRANYCDNAK